MAIDSRPNLAPYILYIFGSKEIDIKGMPRTLFRAKAFEAQ